MEHERHERHRLHCLDRKDERAMNVLMLSREYPPHIYGGAGVVVDELSRAMSRLARVEVRCFGDQRAAGPPLGVQGYAPTADIGRAAAAFRHRPVLEALAVDLAMAADPVEADVVHGHTWYAAFGGVLVRALFDIPLVVTLHSLEPLRPWKSSRISRWPRSGSW
jgi:alpha-maltose-1-phosphate synthase